MKIAKENTGGGTTHAINCDCYSCTGGDSYLGRVKRNVGRHAAHANYDPFNGNRFAARIGTYGSAYFNHADSPIQPISTTAPAQTVVKTNNNELLNLLGGLASQGLGILMEKQKSGQLNDPVLNQIGKTANDIAQAGVNAGIAETESVVGQNVIKFSPWIIGGIALLLGAMIYLIARKK